MASSALLPRAESEGGRGSSMRRVALLLTAAGCALGLVFAARASASSETALMGLPGGKVGDVMNSLNHKLAVHASVGDFVISGDLQADTQSLK